MIAGSVEWVASPEESRPFAWLSLDPADYDPVRFWSYVIAAIRSLHPELGAGPLISLRSAGPDLADVVVAPLINALAALREPLVLVLDGYHLVRALAILERTVEPDHPTLIAWWENLAAL